MIFMLVLSKYKGNVNHFRIYNIIINNKRGITVMNHDQDY